MRPRTRRELLTETGQAVAVGAIASMPAATAAAKPRPRAKPRRVVVLGAGVGGLTAAHELVERGFSVTVFERRDTLGGKARSIDVPMSSTPGHRPLPGEHGARVFPGYYQNIIDTMRRIPFRSNPNGVFDNLVSVPQEDYARAGGRADLVLPLNIYPAPSLTLDQLRQLLRANYEAGFTKQEADYWVERLLVFFTSCDARRLGEWEHTNWSDFVAAGQFSQDYQRLLVQSATRFVLAAKAEEASARTIGMLWEAGIYNDFGRGSNGSFDRVLNAPTNEAFIDPWVSLLRHRGVRFHLGAEVTGLDVSRGRVTAAHLQVGRQRVRAEADWFVCALPVDRASQLLRGAILALDPSLQNLRGLTTRWENGIQFYLREPTPIARGHVLYIDSPWAVSSISQAQFWNRDFARTYGDGQAKDCLSVVISDFTQPGIVYGRPANQLPPDQLAYEAWTQMKAHLNDTGTTVLHDDLILSWFVDPALSFRQATPTRPGGLTNDDPLLISTPGAWAKRPTAETRIPNLFLAADYVKVNIDTASMEGANEAGRRAANAILKRSRVAAKPAAIYDLYHPPELEPNRSEDAVRYRQGLPNRLDTPTPPQ